MKVALLGVLAAVSALKVDEPCRVGSVVGECAPLLSCLMAARGVSSSENICGYQDQKRLVCCLKSRRPAVWTSPGYSVLPQRDLSRHPNAQLVNGESCGRKSFIISSRILGGSQTGLHEFPWMTRLYMGPGRNKSLNCAGSLINDKYVLTAAHCVPDLTTEQFMSVHLGQHGITERNDCGKTDDSIECAPPTQVIDVEMAVVHPLYSGCCQYFNDIALLRLARTPLFTDFIRPVCLPIELSDLNKDLEKSRLVVTGWGLTEEDVNSPVLRKLSLSAVPNRQCQTALKVYNCEINENQMCAGGELERDSCNGDSGGPLTTSGPDRAVQYGVVSYGGDEGCGVKGVPGVYTRIVSYMDWILDNIHP